MVPTMGPQVGDLAPDFALEGVPALAGGKYHLIVSADKPGFCGRKVIRFRFDPHEDPGGRGFHIDNVTGKFHGAIAQTTPSGT